MHRAGAHKCRIGSHETLIESEGAACALGHNPIMTKRLVFLVPGFFGFTSVGAVRDRKSVV